MIKDIRIICSLAEATNYFEAGGLYVVVQSLYEQQLKKLKHKEQECAMLRKMLADIDSANVKLHNKIDQLKAENDNLKSLIWWIHIGAEGADKATTEYYENRNTPYEENYWKRIRALQPPTYESKYKLALTEIKGIAEENIRIADLEGLNGVYRRGLAKQILQKISEVIK